MRTFLPIVVLFRDDRGFQMPEQIFDFFREFWFRSRFSERESVYHVFVLRFTLGFGSDCLFQLVCFVFKTALSLQGGGPDGLLLFCSYLTQIATHYRHTAHVSNQIIDKGTVQNLQVVLVSRLWSELSACSVE